MLRQGDLLKGRDELVQIRPLGPYHAEMVVRYSGRSMVAANDCNVIMRYGRKSNEIVATVKIARL